MGRFVVRYRGQGPVPAAAVERAAGATGMRIIDQTQRTLLVEGTPEAVHAVFADDAEWLVTAERLYEMPDPKPKVAEKPGPSTRKGNSP